LHTRGPWEWQGVVEEGDERGCAFVVGSNLGGLVGAAMCWPTEYDSGDFSRVEANARLIAAAPELLTALSALIVVADRYDFRHRRADGGYSSLGDTPAVAAARAAVAKATGAA
jgi:hypothetical protein